MHYTVFAVTTDAGETQDSLGFGEESLWDVEGAKFDGTHNLDAEDAAERTTHFLDRMEALGAAVNRNEQSFTVTQQVAQNYFAERYAKLRELVNKLTLPAFASDTGAVWDIQNCIEDEWDDGAYMNGVYYSLDYFLRHEADGKPATYYVRGAVDVHY